MAEINKETIMESVPLPSNTSEDYNELREAITNEEFTVDDENKEYVGIASLGNGLTNSYDMLSKDIDNKHLLDNVTIKANGVTVKGDSARGKKASYMVNSAFNISIPVVVPLPHSGFSITLGIVSPTRNIVLFSAIASDSIGIGSDTAGLVFSNDMHIINKHIMDLLEDTIISSTLDKPDDLLWSEVISINDIELIKAGIIKSSNPKGFEHFQACANVIKGSNCKGAVKGKADISNMLYIDEKAIGDCIANISTGDRNSITYEVIEAVSDDDASDKNNFLTAKEYINNIPKLDDKRVSYTDVAGVETYITYSVPTISIALADGEYWVNYIKSTIDSLPSKAQEERDAVLAELITSTVLSTYSHYISAITVNGVTITDREAIASSLYDISYQKAFVLKISEDTRNFVNDTSLAVIGVPEYICETCKKANTGSRSIIPVNVTEGFFYIRKLKLLKMNSM